MEPTLAIKAVVDYIENRVGEELPAEQVAAATGFSVSHLRMLFRRCTGHSLAGYIRRRRLNHAAYELAQTSRPVSDIAMSYGFGSHDAFTRAFRREFDETPSSFRLNQRTVSGTLIVPGVFGPSVDQKEEIPVVDADGRDSAVLYGVPRVSYAGKEHECTPFISSLRACLSFMGQEESYPRLMVGSGAAFRLMWNLTSWDGGNVDILCMRPDATEPLRRALAAAGRGYELLCKAGKDGHWMAERAPVGVGGVRVGSRREFVELIRRELAAGRPVIGFGIVGPPEACLITGYRGAGETLLGWNFFQDMPEFAGDIEKEPCGYYARRGWYEYQETLAVMSVGEKLPAPDRRGFLRDVLQFGLTVMETPRVYDYAGGLAAFDAWSDALAREGEFPKDAPLPLLFERLMCQADAFTMISEGRWNAHRFLEEEAAAFPEASAQLLAASRRFREEYGVARDMMRVMEDTCMGERAARTLADPHVRRRLVSLIGRAKTLDMKAAEHMRQALLRL